MNKTRINYFDNLRGILIILVLIGHFGGDNTSFSSVENIVLQTVECFIYLFHMPLMFFISGLFSKNVEKCRKNAFFDLFLPYLFFQIFYSIVQVLINKDETYIFNPFWTAPALWYILALFVFRYVIKDILRIKGNLLIAFLLSLFGICLTGLSHDFAMDRIFANLLYFLLGYYFEPQTIIDYKSKIYKNFIRKIIFYICAIVLSLLAFSFLYYLLYTEKLTFANLLGLIGRSKNVHEVGIRLLYGPLIALLGIISSIVFSIIVMVLTPEKKSWLTVVGQDTLPLYLSHMLIQLLYYKIQRRFFFFDNWYLNYGLSFIPVMICVYVFSTHWYRSAFHKMLSLLKKVLVK